MTRESYETVIREMVDAYARLFNPERSTKVADAVVVALLARAEISAAELVKAIKQEFAAHA